MDKNTPIPMDCAEIQGRLPDHAMPVPGRRRLWRVACWAGGGVAAAVVFMILAAEAPSVHKEPQPPESAYEWSAAPEVVEGIFEENFTDGIGIAHAWSPRKWNEFFLCLDGTGEMRDFARSTMSHGEKKAFDLISMSRDLEMSGEFRRSVDVFLKFVEHVEATRIMIHPFSGDDGNGFVNQSARLVLDAALRRSEANDFLGSVIYLDAMLAKFPDTPHTAQALFELARNESRSGNAAGALLGYRKLEAAYPESPWAIEARLNSTVIIFNSGEEENAAKLALKLAEEMEKKGGNIEFGKYLWLHAGVICEMVGPKYLYKSIQCFRKVTGGEYRGMYYDQAAEALKRLRNPNM